MLSHSDQLSPNQWAAHFPKNKFSFFREDTQEKQVVVKPLEPLRKENTLFFIKGKVDDKNKKNITTMVWVGNWTLVIRPLKKRMIIV